MLLLSGSLFAQNTEPDNSKAVTGNTNGQTAITATSNEGLNIQSAATGVTPPEGISSPDAANPTIRREVNSAVDYYTGTANVNVNLYTISSHGVNIPVSVKYSASGIKVDDLPTCIGSNWKMTGAGRITRMVMGEPDETGYYDPRGFNGLGSAYNTWHIPEVIKAINEKYDGEPDIYRFELPTGQSGMFVIHKGQTSDKEILLVPYQDVKIEWMNNTDYANSYFVITDAQGLQYRFGSTAEYRQSETCYKYKRTKTYVSDWLLERVTYGDKEIVRYIYGSFGLFNNRVWSQMNLYTYKGDNTIEGPEGGEWSKGEPNADIEVRPKEVKEIIWDLGKLEFMYDSAALIYGPGHRLNHIKVYGPDYTQCLKTIHTDIVSIHDPGSWGKTRDQTVIARIYEKSGDKVKSICSFQYYDSQQGFPITAINEIDYWGYWTGPNSPKEKYSILGHSFDFHYRKPNLATAKRGTLQKIIYPTGGWTEFEYELHQGYRHYPPTEPSEIKGGLRIKSITQCESPTSAPITTQYAYNDPNSSRNGGEILSDYKPFPRIRKDNGGVGSKRTIHFALTRRPDFAMTDFTGSPVVYPYVKEILPNGSYNTYRFTSFSSFPDMQGIEQESLPNRLEAENYDKNRKVPFSTAFYGRGLLTEMKKYDSSGGEVYSEGYTYDLSAPIKSSVRAYIFYATEEESDSPKFYRGNYRWRSQPVVLLQKTVSASLYNTAQNTSYSYTNDYTDLSPRAITETDALGNSIKSTVSYPQDYPHTSVPVTEGSEGHGIIKLKQMGAKAMPIETIFSKKNDGEANWNVMGAKINIYKWSQTAGMPVLEQTKPLIINGLVPSIAQSMINGDVFVKDSRYDAYNPQNIKFNKQGNPEFITFSGSAGRGTRIIYGYDGNVPVGFITNTLQSSVSYLYCTSFEKGCYSTPDNTVFLGNRAKSGEYALKKGVAHNIFLTLIPHVISYWRWDGNDNTTWEEVRKVVKTVAYVVKEPNHYVDEVRAIPAEASMITQVIKPGAGVISKVDEKGASIRYNYNDFGMLESVADHNGQIVEKYAYSYSDAPESYSLSASVASGSAGRGTASVTPARVNAGGSATWSATPSAGYAFDHWEFSDGTTATTPTATKTNISRNLTGTAFFKEKAKQPVNFHGTIMPKDGYWGINIGCTPDIISEGVPVYATGYFFINPDMPDRIDAQFDGQVREDGYVLSNARFDENNTVGELNGTIYISDPSYTVGTVSWY